VLSTREWLIRALKSGVRIKGVDFHPPGALRDLSNVDLASRAKLVIMMVVLSKANDPNDREEINDRKRFCTGYLVN
jgi:hypothetical protein